MGRRQIAVIVLALSLVGFTVAASAESAGAAKVCDTSWRAAVDGRWDDASNWTHGVPDSPTAACITAAGTYTVTVLGHRTTGALTVGGTSGTQTLSIKGTCKSPANLTTSSAADTIGPHAIVRLHDTGCNSGAELEEDSGPLTNRGTIDVEAASSDAPRRLLGTFVNEGTLRFGAGSYTTIAGGIDDQPSAATEVHLGSSGGAQIQDSEPSFSLDGALHIVADADFVPFDGQRIELCFNCPGRFTTVTGQTLPGGFVVRLHYHDSLGASWLNLKIRKVA